MEDNIQTLLKLFNNLNDEDKIILYNHIKNIVYNIKEKQSQEDLVIDYDQIMSLSWF
jgi:hypothetical protein